jgi:hypothetical protein
MGRKRILAAAALACFTLLVWGAGLLQAGPALARRDAPNLDVRVTVADDSFQALKQRPVMVSVIKDGEIVKQTETALNSAVHFSLPVGLYDLRFEGDGMQTLVKRGVHVIEGEKTEIIGGPMRAGVGVRTVEYAVGGLSREEVAARLAKLEAAVAELQKGRQPR